MYVPDQFKTQEMCNDAVDAEPRVLEFVSNQFKTQEMCNDAAGAGPWVLWFVPDHFKTAQMCEEAVKKYPWLLADVGTWYEGYIKRKAMKKNIKEELMPVAWHPDRYWDWCVPEDEKSELEAWFDK